MNSSKDHISTQAVRGGIWVALSTYWIVGFGFVANIILTRILGPDIYGVFALAMFTSLLLRVDSKLGLDMAYAREGTSSRETVTFLILQVGSSLSGLLIALIITPLWTIAGYMPLIAQASFGLAIAMTMDGISLAGMTVLEKKMQFHRTSRIQAIVFPFSYLPAFWLATHQGGVWSLISQSITYNLLTAICVWVAVRRELEHPGFDWKLAKQMLRYGITRGLGNLAGMLVTQVDNFIIGSMLGVRTVGYYDRGYKTAQWTALLFNSVLNRVGMVVYARLQFERKRLEKAVNQVLWTANTISVPVEVGVFLCAPDLLEMLYGRNWLPAVPYLRWLALVMILRPLWENAAVFLSAVGKARSATVILWTQVVWICLAGSGLILLWGANGMLIAVILSFIGAVIAAYCLIRRVVHMDWLRMAGYPLAGGLITVAVYYMCRGFPFLDGFPAWLRVIVRGGYGLLIPFGLILLMQWKSVQSRLDEWKTLWRMRSEETK